MDTAVELMLSAVRTQVCGGERYLFGKLSLETMQELYAVSKSQDLAHIVAVELEQQGLLSETDAEIAAKFRKQQMIAILRYERINYELEAICKVLEQEKIPHMPLKGSVLRQYYPEPWMRTSADIDLLVHEEDLDRAVRVLADQLNYQNEGKLEHDVQLIAPSGVHLELHFDTIEDYCVMGANSVLKEIWEYAEPESSYLYRNTTTDAMFYFYHCAHMAKHVKNGGCGVRFFLDTWILNHVQHLTEEQKEQRNELLQRASLCEFARMSEQLSDVWFSEAPHDSNTRMMEQYILMGGIYGSSDNSIAVKQAKVGGKGRYVLHLIFLPYREMILRYKILKKHAWLLPFFHIRRWSSLIFGAKRSLNTIKKSSEIADTRTNDVQTMLRTLGLLE